MLRAEPAQHVAERGDAVVVEPELGRLAGVDQRSPSGSRRWRALARLQRDACEPREHVLYRGPLAGDRQRGWLGLRRGPVAVELCI